MELTILGVNKGERVAVGLPKQTIEKTWYEVTDDFGNGTREYRQRENVIEERIDNNNIYFNDVLPDDGVINLPDSLEGMTMMVVTVNYSMNYTFDENTKITVFKR